MKTLFTLFVWTLICSTASNAFADALYGYFNEELNRSAWPDNDGSETFFPEEKGFPGQARAALSASRDWEIATLTASHHGAVLVTALYRGTLADESSFDSSAWSLLIAVDPEGRLQEPRIIRWASGLTPVNARAVQNGFQIQFHDLVDGGVHNLNLLANGTIEEAPSLPDPVVQPEDMPEGSGG